MIHPKPKPPHHPRDHLDPLWAVILAAMILFFVLAYWSPERGY